MGGHKVEVVSELRAWEGKGNLIEQNKISAQAFDEIERLIHTLQGRPAGQKPQAWFSYHLYHKAPDWIGPKVADALNIPYVVAEASLAMKQTQGDWSAGLQQVIHALEQAAAIICLNPMDIPALEKHAGLSNKLHRLMPFIDNSKFSPHQKILYRTALAQQTGLDPALPWLISVAMMRDDAKLKSYQLLAATLARLRQPFQLLLIGDGKARHKVEALFSGKLAKCTHFAGELDQAATLNALTAADVFVWPAVNEAIGMAILEAQACGLPVVAGASGAIPELVLEGETGFVCAPDNTHKIAKAIDRLLREPELRRQFSHAAMENVTQHHSLRTAADSLDQIFGSLYH